MKMENQQAYLQYSLLPKKTRNTTIQPLKIEIAKQVIRKGINLPHSAKSPLSCQDLFDTFFQRFANVLLSLLPVFWLTMIYTAESGLMLSCNNESPQCFLHPILLAGGWHAPFTLNEGNPIFGAITTLPERYAVTGVRRNGLQFQLFNRQCQKPGINFTQNIKSIYLLLLKLQYLCILNNHIWTH